MTTRYTHIGLEDQARGIKNLASDPKWLENRDLDEQNSQLIYSDLPHICSKSCVPEGQGETQSDTSCHSERDGSVETSRYQIATCGTEGQSEEPPVTLRQEAEGTGFEPATP